MVARSDAIPGPPQMRRRHGSSAPQGPLPQTYQPNPLDSDSPREACGVVGVFAPGDDVANVAYFGLFALQHRGQESAGIATADGRDMVLHTAMGLVAQAFREEDLERLTGHIAIGHTRYSTTGAPRRANALAWAAIRETWEEAGLLVGEPGDIEQNNQSPIHGAFAEAGLTPGAHKLDYIARAITPTRSPIRFNTRFFLTGGDATFGDLHVSSELEDIGWRSVSETLNELKIMSVTAFALEEAVTFWRESPTPDPNRLVPRFTHLAEPRRILLE